MGSRRPEHRLRRPERRCASGCFPRAFHMKHRSTFEASRYNSCNIQMKTNEMKHLKHSSGADMQHSDLLLQHPDKTLNIRLE